MMNTKKMMMVCMTGAMILGAATTASASFSFDFNTRKSNSETTTVTNNQGKEYQVTHTIKTENGVTTESYENVPIDINNETGDDIAELYVAYSSNDNWGDNWLVLNGEAVIFPDGLSLNGITMDYALDNTMLDVKIVLADGNYAEFPCCDLANLGDPRHIDMTFAVNEDGDYTLTY